jgi:hypothetical protein
LSRTIEEVTYEFYRIDPGSTPFNRRSSKMRLFVIIGLILVVLGIAALAVPSFTFFTTERVADVGFFSIDVSRPHTIVLNPIVGGIALAAGILLTIVGVRSGSG